MNVAGASVAMNQSQVKSEASMAVMKKAMTEAKENNNAMNEMMKTTQVQAQHPTLGNSIDLKG